MAKHSPDLLNIVKNLPHQAGVYRFLDSKGKIIYIGKAKDLRKRVGSYFSTGRGHSYRIRRMVGSIAELAYTITNSELEALLLENNLIKNHQPRYNILLKDGKTYPYICIKNEHFPRVFSTRNKRNDGSAYFGPYPGVGVMRSILNLIRGYIKLRNCNYDMKQSKIDAGKFKICMEYQIGNCAAPCIGKQDEADYNESIAQVRHILKGKLGPVLDRLKELMMEASECFEFERADYYKKKIMQVKAYREKSTVVSPTVGNVEVLTVICEEHLAMVNHFKVQDGAIIQSHAFEMKRNNKEEEDEILLAAFVRLLNGDDELFPQWISDTEMPRQEEFQDFEFAVPKIGDKKHLVELSLKNSKLLLTEKLYNQNFKKRKTPGEAMVEELQKVLQLKSPPDHIECIDNSNFQGHFPVASLVVFKNGRPAKKDYRHFNIKTVEGPDDFASMEEVVERRFTRLIKYNEPFPKLLIVDGGKGQLSSAVKSLRKLGIYEKVPIIGIAKRLEEIYVPEDSIPLHIDKKNSGLRLIQQMRDEAHRFAITHHRNRRSKGANQKSALSAIKGIGPESEKQILRIYKSVKKLKAASEEELLKVVGKHKTALILKAKAEGVI